VLLRMAISPSARRKVLFWRDANRYSHINVFPGAEEVALFLYFKW
jgi:hypothetical protein